MRLLLDECIPRPLLRDLSSHDVHHVVDMGWSSKRNGELLQLMLAERFEALFTLEGQDFQAFTTSTSASDVFTIGVPFTFGDRFLLTLWLFSTAGTIGVCDELTPTACPETEGTTPYLASGVGASSADFFNTLVLSGLVPKIGGIPVANPVFTADSGAQYTVNGVVPEPGTLLLLGTGVTFLLARRRNNRSC